MPELRQEHPVPCTTHHRACDCREATYAAAIHDLLDQLADTGVDTVHHPARQLLDGGHDTVLDVLAAVAAAHGIIGWDLDQHPDRVAARRAHAHSLRTP